MHRGYANHATHTSTANHRRPGEINANLTGKYVQKASGPNASRDNTPRGEAANDDSMLVTRTITGINFKYIPYLTFSTVVSCPGDGDDGVCTGGAISPVPGGVFPGGATVRSISGRSLW